MRQFCSRETLKFDEPIAGSAMPVKRYAFIGWPRAQWDFNHVIPKQAPPDLEAVVNEIDRAGSAEIRMFNHKHTGDTTRVLFCPEMVEVRDIPLHQVGECLRAYLLGLPLQWPSRHLPGEHLFICTHGVRDRCCAKFGYGTVRKLQQSPDTLSSARHRFTLWETSHLVGDRFAGTGIHFPSGNMYGRLNPDNALELFASLDRDQVFPPCYRGNVFLDTRQQAVEAHARTFMYEQGINGEVSWREYGDNHFDISIDSGNERYRGSVNLEQRCFSFYSNCRQMDAEEPSRKLRWVVVKASVFRRLA